MMERYTLFFIYTFFHEKVSTQGLFILMVYIVTLWSKVLQLNVAVYTY